MIETRALLLKYKRDLEIELVRVNAALETGTFKGFERNNMCWIWTGSLN